MTSFQASVRIERPVEEVFAYVSEPEHFPRWNSAVQTVRKTSSREEPVGSTYAMTRQLPGGQAENELEITTLRAATRVRHSNVVRADTVRLPLRVLPKRRRNPP